jgi:hypothetical protein
LLTLGIGVTLVAIIGLGAFFAYTYQAQQKADRLANPALQAVDAIRACRYHTQNTADRCDCWLQVRAFCYEVWRREGKESPIGWRADALWSLAEREQHTNHGNTVELDESPSYTGPTFSDGLTARDYTEQKLSKK